MAVNYSLTGTETIAIVPQLPGNFKGHIIKGATPSYVTTRSGHIISQTINTEKTSFSEQVLHWNKLEPIERDYNFASGLFTRISIDQPIIEKITGIGEFETGKNQFAAFTGTNWSGAFITRDVGTYHFIDLWWSVEFLRDLLGEYPRLHEMVKNITPGYPDQVIGPLHTLTSDMRTVINELGGLNYYSPYKRKMLHEKMKKLARLIIGELMEMKETKKGFKENQWQSAEKAIAIVDADPYTYINIQQLVEKVGLNEYDLKKAIKARTGMGVDEYRKSTVYRLTAKKMINTEEPVELYDEKNGSASMGNFNRAFKKIYGCTPYQLRLQKPEEAPYVIPEEEQLKYGTMIAKHMANKLPFEQNIILNKWLVLHKANMKLVDDLIDDEHTQLAKDWFKAKNIKTKGIKWMKGGGWYKLTAEKREKKEVMWGFVFVIVATAGYKLELEYGVQGIIQFIRDFFKWIGIG